MTYSFDSVAVSASQHKAHSQLGLCKWWWILLVSLRASWTQRTSEITYMISLFSLTVSNAWQECRWKCLAITAKEVPVFIFRCDIESDLGVKLPRYDYNSALCISQHFNLCNLSLLARVNVIIIKINNRTALATLGQWLEHQTAGLCVWFPSPLQEYIFLTYIRNIRLSLLD